MLILWRMEEFPLHPTKTHTITEDARFLLEHKITKTELIRMITNPNVKPCANRTSAWVQSSGIHTTVCSMLFPVQGILEQKSFVQYHM
jgi:hypothetical protein